MAAGKGVRIAVVGAGIVGMSSGVCIKETFPDVHVTVLADEFSPNTTSDMAGALVHPTSPAGSPRQQKWFKDSFAHFKRISCSEDASESGVSLVYGYGLECSQRPWFYQDTVLGLRVVPEEERLMMNLPDLKSWLFYGTFVVNCRQYLPWLMRQFEEKGGVILRRRVDSLQKLFTEFDVVVNCSGLGARELAQDSSLQPAWGQGRLVKAPWIKYFVFGHLPDSHSSDDTIEEVIDIFPRTDGCFVGGVKVHGKGKGPVDDGYRRKIWQRAEDIMPSLSNAPTINEWTGVRPIRKTVQLLIEEGTTPGKCIIHNYGHGGYGITFSWGCALEVVECVRGVLANGTISSKL